MICIKNIIVEL